MSKQNSAHSTQVRVDCALATHNGWTFERIDELEIRVTAPDGEAWRLRYALESDPFNYFLWRMAQGMLGG